MQKLKLARAVSISLALAFTGYATGETMSKDQHSTEKDKIASEYKSHKANCANMSGNAKDVCKADAEGKEKVAKANLEMNYKPSSKATYEAKLAKAEHEYEVANEKCDDLSGNNKDVCVKAAKDARVHAKSDAKIQMETDKAQVKVSDATGDANQKASAKIADAKQDAAKDKRNADYALAKEKCDSLSGDAKDTCVSKAKTRYAQ
ncbi:MAG: hypothetical protein H7Y28_09845 [Rhodoferax sp.]|nr:hypothetical protein [Rhodoferax sp.]